MFNLKILLVKSLLFVAISLATSSVFAITLNGFNLDNALIDSSKIMAGGPPKDGIPAINEPKFVKVENALHMQENDRILGIEVNGVAKAYPIGILNWHEIVNDQIENVGFAVTFCPLCGTGVAFSSLVNGKHLNFGVSGLLYNSDVLLYDRETESLWSQIISKAISGKLKGNKLQKLPVTHTTWVDWKETHPQTVVLSDKTGYSRDYRRNPYSGYEKSRGLYFQVTNKAPDNFHPKERVLGLEVDGKYKAYPFSEIAKTQGNTFNDQFNKKSVTIHWDKNNQKASITEPSGRQISVIEGYWFAWFAFHPDTEVYYH